MHGKLGGGGWGGGEDMEPGEVAADTLIEEGVINIVRGGGRAGTTVVSASIHKYFSAIQRSNKLSSKNCNICNALKDINYCISGEG